MTQPVFSLSWILPHVRRGVVARSNFEYGTFILQLWQELERLHVKGVVRAAPNSANLMYVYDWNQAPTQLHSAAAEAFFYLLHNGYLVPVTGTGPSNIQMHRFNVTARGLQWFEGKDDPLPEDIAGYMKFLTDRVPGLDDVVKQYVTEALIAFERGAYFAAAVMLGAASEKALYMLADAVLPALKHPAHRTKLDNLMTRRKLVQFFEFIRDVIERNGRVLGFQSDGAMTYLMSMFEAVRKQRNDAVHPDTAQVSADSVRLLTASFPHALSKSEELRRWMLNNRQSLD